MYGHDNGAEESEMHFLTCLMAPFIYADVPALVLTHGIECEHEQIRSFSIL